MTDALNADHITKVFGGLTAVDDVSLHVGEKELVALIGPNGAGKTTFFNCLTGVGPATTGTVKIGGQEVKKNTKAYKDSVKWSKFLGMDYRTMADAVAGRRHPARRLAGTA